MLTKEHKLKNKYTRKQKHQVSRIYQRVGQHRLYLRCSGGVAQHKTIEAGKKGVAC